MPILFFFSCDKKLSGEQKKAFQEEANARKIQRITNQQLVEFLIPKTQGVEEMLNNQQFSEALFRQALDSVGRVHKVEYSESGDLSTGKLLEVWEAYMYAVAGGEEISSNLQQLESGDFIYTIPYVEDSAGITMLRGVWKVEFSRKELIKEYSLSAD